MIVACVRSGTAYHTEYVYKLRSMVSRYLGPHRFICLTDRPEDLSGVRIVHIPHYPKWWGKMYLFKESWRPSDYVIYFDLDTVVCGDLTPLTKIQSFAVCRNFTQIAGYNTWPCRYGSCTMVIPPKWGNFIWSYFVKNIVANVRKYERYGDQKLIEDLVPDAGFLQDLTSPGFFVGYRDFTDTMPTGASVLVFAGKVKPHNSKFNWVKELWR